MATIKLFAGSFTPQGYMDCNGALLSISQYSALYSLLGTMYGGNGTATFALPDLRSRIPVGIGTGTGLTTYDQGQTGGSETNTLTVNNLPNHTHSAVLNVNASQSDASLPVTGASIAMPGTASGRSFTPTLGFNSDTPNIALNTSSVQVGATGNAVAVNNIQPFLGLRYIICVQGIYPSRD